MAWKGRNQAGIEIESLLAPLLNSKLQQTNNPLFYVVSELIKRLGQERDRLATVINEVVGDIAAVGDTTIVADAILKSATFLTVNDETLQLPNSRRLLAGTNITFDDSVAGERTISASGGVSADYVVMSDGATPIPAAVNDGFGNFIYISYTP